ncbi:hypothetical protein ACSRC5_14860 [Salmonella enterica]|uniref:hypothetical protein n=1 Tax=Salmonella enterica TaxID=28901 RepID=UPI0009AFBF51|nr:hypothetical protein [Salmonella enterica]EDX8937354.1 hypothetical protein [Salmonella enterica subsp. enterica serovar Havana]EHS5457053.1 hypothetical protein [Salmonella enterica subsp. enterica serovar Corvallis]EJL3599861.1 hypothetical protein [Salmonella enterica subsp. enterica serovar Waycross]EAA9735963.1 hypothetical protein [Salmonella enterica]EAQ7295803.1 hypothetical protein [Salmonella enterica]
MFGSGSRSRSDFITHTFLMNKAKSANWNNVHAYSWGNGGNTKGWNKDQPEDISAAEAALYFGEAERVDGIDDDSCIQAAFDALNKKENEHMNLFIARNCKVEADKLIEKAKKVCAAKKMILFFKCEKLCLK